MGYYAGHRERGAKCPSIRHSVSSYRNSPHIQVSKKSRYSSVLPWNTTIRRMDRYPEAKSPLRREVHAPSRAKLRFGSSSHSVPDGNVKDDDDCGKQVTTHEMEKFLKEKYDSLKQKALGSLRFVRKDRVVIDLDQETPKESTVDISNSDEVEVIETGSGNTVEKKNVQLAFPSVITDLDNGDNLRVGEAGKMLDSLSLNRQVLDISSLDDYRKLVESAKRRTSRLTELGFDIVLNERRSALLRESRLFTIPVKKPAKEIPLEPFVPLTKEEESDVQHAFSASCLRKVIVTHKNSNIDITGQILQCLRPGAWLNDEVINVYLELLKERETREPQKFLKCHFFNTFFYKKLMSDGSGYNYKSVRRWTSQKKLGYFLTDCDMIFVPIHKEIHWCLAIINRKDSKFQYLDSLKGMDTRVLNALAKYFAEEAKDKSGKNIDVSSWGLESLEDLPKQENGYDCGMFMVKYIDFYSRGLSLCFGQEHMPYFRVRTAKEILRLQAD